MDKPTNIKPLVHAR